MDPLLIIIGLIAALSLIVNIGLSNKLNTGAPSETMLNLDKRTAETARRLAVIMSYLGISDEATRHLDELLEVKLQEAEDIIKSIDAVAETRKAALREDLKAIKAKLLGKP
jgi:predicted HAD superfamily phosphohydrolase